MMPAVATHAALFGVLVGEWPGGGPVPAGVLLEDPNTNRIHLRMRHDWDFLAPEESDVLSALESDLAQKAEEMGAVLLLEWLTQTLSNNLRIREPREIMVEVFLRALCILNRETVSATGQP